MEIGVNPQTLLSLLLLAIGIFGIALWDRAVFNSSTNWERAFYISISSILLCGSFFALTRKLMWIFILFMMLLMAMFDFASLPPFFYIISVVPSMLYFAFHIMRIMDFQRIEQSSIRILYEKLLTETEELDCMDLENLIGSEKLRMLKKKHPSLKELFYLCSCETCGKVFFEETLERVQQMLLSGEWDPFVPMDWYLEAAEHWLKGKYHSIRVVVKDRFGDQTLVKDLSKEWLVNQKLKGLSDKQLKEEIKRLKSLRK